MTDPITRTRFHRVKDFFGVIGFSANVDFGNEINYNIFELISRGDQMDYMTELTAIAQEHGGIIETKIAIAHGISKAMLYKLCKDNKIQRVVQGQYILPEDMQDELLSISKRSEQIIYSHETALFLHGYSIPAPETFMMLTYWQRHRSFTLAIQKLPT